jgi:hypothetical protein
MYYVAQAVGWVELSAVVIMYNMDYFAKRNYLFCSAEYLDRLNDLGGTCVVNPQYGIGEIVAYDNGIIRVEFEKVRVSYMYPEAFKQNILRWGTIENKESLMARKQAKKTSNPTHEQATTKISDDNQSPNTEATSCTITNEPKGNSPEALKNLRDVFCVKLKTSLNLDYVKNIGELAFDEDYEGVIARIEKPFQYLETVMNKYGEFKECQGDTDIFIYPGYTFKAIDALITNFHLPKSTLIMLISALANKDYILRAYEEAVKERYRFFSFGDSMFIQ